MALSETFFESELFTLLRRGAKRTRAPIAAADCLKRLGFTLSPSLRRWVDFAAAYDRARKTGPTAEEYKRHVDMLNQLHTVTLETAPDIAKTIDGMLTELSTAALPPRTPPGN